MTPHVRVRLLGQVMMGSIALAAAGAVIGPALLGASYPPSGADSVFQMLIYGAAAALIGLTLVAPTLARRLPAGRADGNGPVLAMAMCEGVTLLGIVSAAFVRQTAWVIALALVGMVAIVRVMSTD